MSDVYVKTYKPFGVWFLSFLLILLALPQALRPLVADGILIDSMFAIIYLGLLSLFILIHRGEYVYWINGGPTFEEARDAGEQCRREYAWKHLKRFLAVGSPLIPYLVLSSVLSWPTWLDAIIFGVTVSAAALSTVNIRFAPPQEETK